MPGLLNSPSNRIITNGMPGEPFFSYIVIPALTISLAAVLNFVSRHDTDPTPRFRNLAVGNDLIAAGIMSYLLLLLTTGSTYTWRDLVALVIMMMGIALTTRVVAQFGWEGPPKCRQPSLFYGVALPVLGAFATIATVILRFSAS